MDLDVALLTFEEDRTVTQQRLIVLMETAQQLENEADAMREEAERHQEVVQWTLASAEPHDDNLGDIQLPELQSLIQDLNKSAKSKVWPLKILMTGC